MTGTQAPGARLLGLGKRRLILASTSPRRMELLASLGVVFEVAPVGIDETIAPGESAEMACVRLAETKARAVGTGVSDAWVLGADTIVVQDGIVLGKPRDDADAAGMLRQLSGHAHEVWTGVAILRTADGRVFLGAERTRVWFDELTEATVELLVRSGECHDKAGAYGIQGLAGLFVSRIDGDYYNVMGLPLARLRRLCMEAS
jgi:nucleoside triphosphate pyrophosphatase